MRSLNSSREMRPDCCLECLIEVGMGCVKLGEGCSRALDSQFYAGELDGGAGRVFFVLVAFDVAQPAFHTVHPCLQFVHVRPEQEKLGGELQELLSEDVRSELVPQIRVLLQGTQYVL